MVRPGYTLLHRAWLQNSRGMTWFLALTPANMSWAEGQFSLECGIYSWLGSFSISFKAQENGTAESEHHYQSPDSFVMQIFSLRH